MSTTERTIGGTVTSLSPLTVEVDGSAIAVPATSNVAAALAVGQRVELALRTPHAPIITGIRAASGSISLQAANFEPAWTTWTPTWTGHGGMTVSSVNNLCAKYLKIGSFVFFIIYATMTLGGTAGVRLYFTLPATADVNAYFAHPYIYNNSADRLGHAWTMDTTKWQFSFIPDGNWTLGYTIVGCSGWYERA